MVGRQYTIINYRVSNNLNYNVQFCFHISASDIRHGKKTELKRSRILITNAVRKRNEDESSGDMLHTILFP